MPQINRWRVYAYICNKGTAEYVTENQEVGVHGAVGSPISQKRSVRKVRQAVKVKARRPEDETIGATRKLRQGLAQIQKSGPPGLLHCHGDLTVCNILMPI